MLMTWPTLNFTRADVAWFNECRDIAPEIIDALCPKRVGRFPKGDRHSPSIKTLMYSFRDRPWVS